MEREAGGMRIRFDAIEWGRMTRIQRRRQFLRFRDTQICMGDSYIPGYRVPRCAVLRRNRNRQEGIQKGMGTAFSLTALESAE